MKTAKEESTMDIKISNDFNTEVLVINKFEGEKTSQELAITYAVERDNFEGKLGEGKSSVFSTIR